MTTVRFLLAKPVTIVTFDVPQQQEELPLTTSELCRVMENIESYNNEECGSVLIVIWSFSISMVTGLSQPYC